MIKIYGVPLSTATGRVLYTLKEKGVPYELVHLNLTAGEQKQPDFLALQPFGQVPVLKDGELTMFESRAICRYICDKFAGQGTALYGKSLQEKAMVEQWLEVEAQNFNPPIATLVFQLVISKFKGLNPDVEIVEANIQKLESVLQVYEKHLASNEYLANNAFSLADLSHVPYMNYLMNMTDKTSIVTSKANVYAWWKRISSRPAWEELAAAAKQSA